MIQLPCSAITTDSINLKYALAQLRDYVKPYSDPQLTAEKKWVTMRRMMCILVQNPKQELRIGGYYGTK